MLRLCYAPKSLTTRHRDLSVWWSLNMLRAESCCDEQQAVGRIDPMRLRIFALFSYRLAS